MSSSLLPPYFTRRWLGSESAHFDQPDVASCAGAFLGCYGGNTQAGATQNEDAALIWRAADASWTFAAVLDAHNTSQSAELVLNAIDAERTRIVSALVEPPQEAFRSLHQLLRVTFSSDSFRRQCRQVRGETACLICTQTQQFLFWFSVGDCVAYVLHPEFARLGQYALNQRQFYEWIGRANTFDRQVPCYTSGVRELRQSDHVIALITDGLLECGARPFADPQTLYDSLTSRNIHGLITLESNVGNVLQRVHAEQGQDSATIVAWQYVGNQTGASPSEQ